MNIIVKNIIPALLISLTGTNTAAQVTYTDELGRARETVTGPDTRTIQLYREGWPLSYPVVRLDADVPLVLEFDDISGDYPDYFYTIVHCNADWTFSDLPQQEYLQGFLENQVPDGEPSFNTYYNYRHYTLVLPNENARMLLSGNYLLQVYRNRDPQDVAFTKRFMVTEASVSIEASAKVPTLSRYKGCCQEVDFTVTHAGLGIDDPFTTTGAAIYQNGLWDMGVEGLMPFMIRADRLEYDYQEENIFPGGNEYRFFDTKNTRTPSYYIKRIEYIDPYFHFELKTDEPNPAHLYFSGDDINGRFHIESESGINPDVDADYVFVHFELKMPQPMDGSVYVAGGLTGWQFNESNRMEWVAGEGVYRKTLLLKQGVYNYRYLFLPTGASRFDVSAIEGSHYETENEYLILFYHRPPGARYDRLLGHQVVHSNQ